MKRICHYVRKYSFSDFCRKCTIYELNRDLMARGCINWLVLAVDNRPLWSYFMQLACCSYIKPHHNRPCHVCPKMLLEWTSSVHLTDIYCRVLWQEPDVAPKLSAFSRCIVVLKLPKWFLFIKGKRVFMLVACNKGFRRNGDSRDWEARKTSVADLNVKWKEQ